uniref:Uncharacterized protein n=1 Tax=Arundo donax TaxID=35708 RepID=A0A0A9HEN0_ARUDO
MASSALHSFLGGEGERNSLYYSNTPVRMAGEPELGKFMQNGPKCK